MNDVIINLYKTQLKLVHSLVAALINQTNLENDGVLLQFKEKIHQIAGTVGYFENEIFSQKCKQMDQLMQLQEGSQINDQILEQLKELQTFIQASVHWEAK